jgi:hypothetical protein
MPNESNETSNVAFEAWDDLNETSKMPFEMHYTAKNAGFALIRVKNSGKMAEFRP